LKSAIGSWLLKIAGSMAIQKLNYNYYPSLSIGKSNGIFGGCKVLVLERVIDEDDAVVVGWIVEGTATGRCLLIFVGHFFDFDGIFSHGFRI
jgi:hypothetical protein